MVINRAIKQVGFPFLLAAFAWLICAEGQALAGQSGLGNEIRSYVIHFEGNLGLSSSEVEKQLSSVFQDADSSKVIHETAFKNLIGSQFYQLEGFIEARSQQTVDYVEKYIEAHPEYEIGGTKIQLLPAKSLVALNEVSAYGPDKTGKEVRWGAFTRLIQFPNVGTYNNYFTLVGPAMAAGTRDQVATLLPAILNGMDATFIADYLQHNLSRVHWDSFSYFVMDDDTYVNRLLEFRAESHFSHEAATESPEADTKGERVKMMIKSSFGRDPLRKPAR